MGVDEHYSNMLVIHQRLMFLAGLGVMKVPPQSKRRHLPDGGYCFTLIRISVHAFFYVHFSAVGGGCASITSYLRWSVTALLEWAYPTCRYVLWSVIGPVLPGGALSTLLHPVKHALACAGSNHLTDVTAELHNKHVMIPILRS